MPQPKKLPSKLIQCSASTEKGNGWMVKDVLKDGWISGPVQQSEE